MGSKNPGIRDVEFFESLLFMDTIRGPHSTGVVSMFKNEGYNTGIHTVIRKLAVTGPEFLASKLYEEVAVEKTPGYTANSFIVKRPNLMLGHNRWATRGEINAINAHPFRSGNISLVHNGTLVDQSLLPDHANYEVDSANICHSINKIGAAATIQLLDGAYTLAWINEEDNTFNIIRNKERPFHIVELNTGDYFGASEEDMLMWVLTRGKVKPTIKRHFECEVGTQYVFDITNGTFLFKEEIKHELPTFQKTYYYPSSTSSSTLYDDYDEYYNRNYHTPAYETYAQKKERQNKEIEKEGLKVRIGDMVTFNVSEWKPYKTYNNANPPYGKIEGYLEPYDGWVEIEANGILGATYELLKEKLWEGKILDVVETKDQTLRFSLGSIGEAKEPLDMKAPKSLLPTVVPITSRTVNTVAQEVGMNKLLKDRGLFVEIDDDITFIADEFKKSVATTAMGTMHGMLHPCSKEVTVTILQCPENIFECGAMYEAQLLRASIVTGNKLHLIAKAAMKTSIPVEHEQPIGFDETPIDLTGLSDDAPEDEEFWSETRRTLSGETFTRKEWKDKKLGECSGCSSVIAFEDADQCYLLSGYTICPDCAEVENDLPTIISKEKEEGEIVDLPWNKRPLKTVSGISTAVHQVYFACTVCNKRLPAAKNSGNDVCTECAPKKYQSAASSSGSRIGSNRPHKRIQNGFYINEDMWSRMNTCKCCNQKLDWLQAENYTLIGGSPVCFTCEDLMQSK